MSPLGMSHTLVGNIIVDCSDVVGESPVQLHLHSRLNIWLQWIGQRQLKDKTINICVLGFGASYIRGLTVTEILPQYNDHWWHDVTRSQGISSHGIDPIDQSHKSHNAPVPYPKMHHFVTEMCTHVHISVTKWCIVGYWADALWNLWDWSIFQPPTPNR